MPELKPCPACGSPVDIVGGDEWHNRNQFFIKCSCGSCCVADTVRKECIERWNDLPRYRTLRWTHEPPKVVDKMYLAKGMNLIVFLVATVEVNGTLYAQLPDSAENFPLSDFVEWAGPIPLPVE